MFRVVVFALSEDNAREAVLRLKREGYIQIVEWLGVDKGHGVITYNYGELQNIEVLRNYYQVCPKEIYDKVYQRLYVFLDMVYRNGDRSIYEYVNLFNLYVGFYYGMFNQQKVNLLIFGDNPHFGVDSIAKDVATAMGIRCVLFQQAMEKDYFFAFLDSEDIGLFKSLPNESEMNIKIDGQYEKELYYMKNIHIEDLKDDITMGMGICTFVRKIKKHRRHLLNKMKERAYTFIEKKSRLWLKQNAYSQNLKCVSQNHILNLTIKYVYFPLHMQPESTTSVLGGEYCDQILAIERLAQMIPDDWRIYVKENPIQTYYMREELFFRRLQLIPQVQFVGREFNTYDLIRCSQFVATITGTAGWEAISGGKPVLVFGLAWYRKFPGVFEYQNNPSLDDILHCKINIREVEAAYNRLHSKAYPGVLELGPETAIENYSHEENNKLLYKAFVHILDLLQAGDAQPTD